MYVERKSCLSSVGKEEKEEEEEGWDYLTPLHNTRYRQELSEGKRGEEKSDATASQARGSNSRYCQWSLLRLGQRGRKMFLSWKEGKRGVNSFFFAMFGFFCLRENDRRSV